MEDLSFIVLLIATIIVVVLALEIWVIILISGMCASYFGFSGLLWWVCAFMMFCIINGLLGAIWNISR